MLAIHRRFLWIYLFTKGDIPYRMRIFPTDPPDRIPQHRLLSMLPCMLPSIQAIGLHGRSPEAHRTRDLTALSKEYD